MAAFIGSNGSAPPELEGSLPTIFGSLADGEGKEDSSQCAIEELNITQAPTPDANKLAFAREDEIIVVGNLPTTNLRIESIVKI